MDKHKIAFIASCVAILLAIVFIMHIAFLQFFPFKVAEFKPVAELVNKKILRGDPILYHLEGCIYRESEVTIDRTIENGVMFRLPTIHTTSKKGCIDDIVSTTYVPEEFFTGIFKLRVRVTHQVNYLQERVIEWETEEFEIIDGKVSGISTTN